MSEEQDISIEETEGPARKNSGSGKAIVIVIVLTLLAIWLVPGKKADKAEKPAQTAPAQRPSLLQQDKAGATATPGEQAATSGEAATPKTSKTLGPGAAARQLIERLRNQAPPDLEQAYKTARQFQAQGKSDDAYLLYFFAAREGHGPSAMVLAREADPATFKQGGLFAAPDPLQANKWYAAAAAAGVKDADKALNALRRNIERKAAAGDDAARRITLQWK